MPYVVQPMQIEDVDEVSRVERECFTTPWPVNAYRRELRENRLSRYIVVRWLSSGEATLAPREQTAVEQPEPLGGVKRAVSQLLRPFGLAADQSRPSQAAILGFAGMWMMFDEAHVTTIGVKRSMRGRGLGELMLVCLIEQAEQLDAKRLTLEVRVSNTVAQALYKKYTFKEEGIRKRYYSDDGEDALIMWSDRIDEPAFQDRFARLKSDLEARIADAPGPEEPVTER